MPNFIFLKRSKTSGLKQTFTGLHELLSKEGSNLLFHPDSFECPRLKELKETLDSAFNQTAPMFEVIVEVKPEEGGRLKPLLDRYPALKINQEPKGDIIFLLGQHEGMRVDLLYRYEQVFRKKGVKRLVLYTEPVFLDQKGMLVHGTTQAARRALSFPFEFEPLRLPGAALSLVRFGAGMPPL